MPDNSNLREEGVRRWCPSSWTFTIRTSVAWQSLRRRVPASTLKRHSLATTTVGPSCQPLLGAVSVLLSVPIESCPNADTEDPGLLFKLLSFGPAPTPTKGLGLMDGIAFKNVHNTGEQNGYDLAQVKCL